MKCQFHFLSHINDRGLQMYSENFFKIWPPEFILFFQIFGSKRDTGQFLGEMTVYEQYSFY